MIKLDPDELLENLRELSRLRGVRATLDHRAMVEAVAEAKAYSDQGLWHAPAVLLYAFGRRSLSFGPVGPYFVEILVRAQVVAIQCGLDANDLDITMHMARLVRGQMPLPELAEWFAQRLYPIGQKPQRPPPRRPR
jgi:hypothetical protein